MNRDITGECGSGWVNFKGGKNNWGRSVLYFLIESSKINSQLVN